MAACEWVINSDWDAREGLEDTTKETSKECKCCLSNCCRVGSLGKMCTGIFDGLVDWWIGFQNPSVTLMRLKWGCAVLGKIRCQHIRTSVLWQEIRTQ